MMKKLICIEEHYTSERIRAKINKILGNEDRGTASLNQTQLAASDLGEGRIAYMNSAEISTQVLSCADEYPALLAKEHAVPLCREVNDEMHRASTEHPGRYYCFAILPLSAPEEAAAELERCVKTLGFVGAMLVGHFEGRSYSDEWYFPIFKKAEELNVPIYMHPCKVNSAVAERYYKGAWSPTAESLFASFGVGWHYEVGIEAVRMMLAGIFDRLPGLQIILGHWGEVVAYYMYRLDEIGQNITGLNKSFSRYFKENVYVNPSGMMYEAQFRFCMATFGAERIMWGEDYPYRKPENIAAFLQGLDISEEERAKIAYANAEKLFGV